MPEAPATPGPNEDVVSLLLTQHAQIEELFLLASGSDGQAKVEAFNDLVRLLAVHETAEEEVVHPLSRTLPGDNDALIDERLAEERQAKQTLRVLIDGGVDADGFDEGLALLRTSVLKHARHEERYEFPRLRQHVPADQLRELAAAVRAAEAGAARTPTADDDLDQTTKAELYEAAKEAEIPGRSTMTKEELAEALRSTE